jgi:hypothetical protein
LLGLARGPLRWAPFARFEPYAGSDELAAIDRRHRDGLPLPGNHGRTLYIDLANYFMLKESPHPRDRERARHYAELEVARVPEDPRAWYYYAQAILAAGGPPEKALEAAHRSRELRPSPQVDSLILRISGKPP